jgi:hypothetical protein
MSALQSSRGIMRRPSWWIGYSLLAVVLSVAAPARAATPDAWITTKIKLALLTTDGVSGPPLRWTPSPAR